MRDAAPRGALHALILRFPPQLCASIALKRRRQATRVAELHHWQEMGRGFTNQCLVLTTGCLCLRQQEFLASFLLQNPLAQIALVFMADAAAEVLCPAAAAAATEASPATLGAPGAVPGAVPLGASSYFSSNVEELVTALVARRRRRNLPTAHAPSLKNGLDVRCTSVQIAGLANRNAYCFVGHST